VSEQAINSTDGLPDRLRPVARCVVLKTVQWAVDCKKRFPTAGGFRERIIEHAESIADGLKTLADQVRSLGSKPATVEAIHGDASDIATLPSKLLLASPPKLVVTSPPYPAMHVLYHRWQVLGRRETPAPFWIADCRDGQGSAFYTFGDRRSSQHEEKYFASLLAAFTAIRKVIRKDAYVVQLLGFGRPESQLPLYLDVMRGAGFAEFEFEKERHRPSREDFWRAVPNRKWYNLVRAEKAQTREVLLVHRVC
jgi:hypothetical protein